MKIGTDGVLLGAWVSLENTPQNILDIGAGTGLIALQLAQRSFAETIDAIEIDDNAYEQCTDNFENSPWADRLFCYHASIQEFASEIDEKYDLVVSNPPFYSEDYKTENTARDTARFTDALPFEHLAISAAHLLSEHGTFAVILPKKEEAHFIELASKRKLFPKRICSVKGTPTAEEKRSLLEFSFHKTEPIMETLIIETTRHHFTKNYMDLVAEFYLKM
ncbi:tRNA1(Val) (adenine(37)-N6)-methyltransferase [Rasiella sp. SM2506]|uniref:tRNA1(Val) (adenine(37)-N6)-methyltransferase n=1 Tax=Rasiella sp. SM2506 TaxID=3423914 RepID=UPI003D7BD6A2